MSIRCSGFASRSFIIGSRLCPPAMMRASEPSLSSDAIAPSTLVARSYSNDAGVCKEAPFVSGIGRGRIRPRGCCPAGEPLARCPDVFPLLVLHGRVGTDDRRPCQGLRSGLADLGVQLPRRQASTLDVPESGTCRVPGSDR